MSDENVYIYCADVYCEACGEDIRKRLTAEGKRPRTWRDETTYDSDEFPKGPYDNGGGEADCPQHCGSGKNCLDPTVLGDGPDDKVGKFLENPLTTDGEKYVLDLAFEASGDQRVIDLWLNHYSEEIGYYLKTNPKHPYHITKLKVTLQAISNDCQRALNGELETESLLAGFIETIADDHNILCEVEDEIDADDGDEDEEDDDDQITG